jgi:hypothetical protein
MKGKLLFAAVVVLLFIAAAVAYKWSQPPYLVTKKNYERIQNGMTLEEVEGILGKLPAWPGRFPSNKNVSYRWFGNGGEVIGVVLGADEKVAGKTLQYEERPPAFTVFLWQNYPTMAFFLMRHNIIENWRPR